MYCIGDGRINEYVWNICKDVSKFYFWNIDGVIHNYIIIAGIEYTLYPPGMIYYLLFEFSSINFGNNVKELIVLLVDLVWI